MNQRFELIRSATYATLVNQLNIRLIESVARIVHIGYDDDSAFAIIDNDVQLVIVPTMPTFGEFVQETDDNESNIALAA